MTKRELVIVELLERYADLTDPMQSRDGLGDGVHVPLMPRTWTASVQELERLLVRMRQDRHSPLVVLPSGEKASVRSLWWHVSERYLRSTVVVRDVPVKRKAKHGKTLTVVERRAVLRVSPQVKNDRVERGVAWLAENWSAAHEPMLPTELLAAA